VVYADDDNGTSLGDIINMMRYKEALLQASRKVGLETESELAIC